MCLSKTRNLLLLLLQEPFVTWGLLPQTQPEVLADQLWYRSSRHGSRAWAPTALSRPQLLSTRPAQQPTTQAQELLGGNVPHGGRARARAGEEDHLLSRVSPLYLSLSLGVSIKWRVVLYAVPNIVPAGTIDGTRDGTAYEGGTIYGTACGTAYGTTFSSRYRRWHCIWKVVP